MHDIHLQLNKTNRLFYVIGDFNINLMKIQENDRVRQYANSLVSCFCRCLIAKPIRLTSTFKTLIDHVYTSDIVNTSTSGVAWCDISDHLAPFVRTSTQKSVSQNNDTYYFRDMKQFHHDLFLENLSENLDITTNLSINQQAELFLKMLNKTIDQNAPLRKATRKEKRLKLKPWLAPGILRSIQKKNSVFKQLHKLHNEKLLQQYKSYHNVLNRTIIRAKQLYYKQNLSENENNPEKIWKTIFKLSNIKQRTRVIPHKPKKETSNDEVTDTQDRVNYLNNFFVNIGPEMTKTISATKFPAPSEPKTFSSTHHSLFLFPSTPPEVCNVIDQLKDKKADCSIDCDTKLVKYGKIVNESFLSQLYNSCQLQGVFPNIFKIAEAVGYLYSRKTTLL